jgi:hypothetical protein
LYCETFLDGLRFREYQQRQVRVYCSFFPLSTRIVAHFCLTSPGQAKPEGPDPYDHIAKFGHDALYHSDVDHDLGYNPDNYLKYKQGMEKAAKHGANGNLVLLATTML